MAQQPYQYQAPQFDRSEMFALGAAAGAVITAAINEYLERRRPKTAWEKAQASAAHTIDTLAETTKQSARRAKEYTGAAGDYVQEILPSSNWKQTKKATRKKSKQARKQALGLKEAATAALGATVATGVIDKVRDYAGSAAERVVGDPYAVSGSIKETLKEQYDSLRSSSDGKLTEKAQEVGETVLETLKHVAATAADAAKDYAGTARETLKDAELGDKAKDYSATVADTVKGYTASARDTLKEAKLGDKAKDYSATVADTLKDYASSARETLKDVELSEKAKGAATLAGAAMATYSAQASRAAKQGATKLTESAADLAEAASEQAGDVRKGVRKGVKRTRRRARWGLRAFVVGLIVGLLAAPQSGQRTRDAITSFVESILDVLMPEESSR